MTEPYRPWDQESKLGPPPWQPADPKLQAWQQAHGHDVRLKCYPEFGCLVTADEYDDSVDYAAEYDDELIAERNLARSVAVQLEQENALLRQTIGCLSSLLGVEYIPIPADAS